MNYSGSTKEVGVKQSLLTRAMLAYGAALSVADPIRLRIWDERGLTLAQLRLMYTILAEGEQPAGDLAGKLGVRPPTVTGLTDRLIKQELIERADDPSDRRVVIVRLTDEGREVIGQIEAESRAYFERIFDRLGEERIEGLIGLLEEFTEVASTVQTEGDLSAVTPGETTA